MPLKTFRQALTEALTFEMARDGDVIIIGEDVTGGIEPDQHGPDAPGGVFGVTSGLVQRFGRERVIDTPISEAALIGMATGAAMMGLRPIAELIFADFVGVCFDQIVNQMAKLRYMSGGQARVPVVVRMPMGAGLGAGAQHSQAIYPLLTAVPGLKCVIPATPYDAKGLLVAAMRDDDPVMFFEHKALYETKGEVPDEPYAIPFGEAAILREGTDATIVGFGKVIHDAAAVTGKLAADGISCDVIDPRTSSPLDAETILDSVAKTGRLIVVDEAPPRCGLAADIAALVARQAFHALKAPVEMVTAPHSPVPFAPDLERLYLPDSARIEAAVRHAMAS